VGGGKAFVGGNGAHDANAIAKFDELVQGVAIAAADRNIADGKSVGGSVAGEEDNGIEGAGGADGQDAVPLADARGLNAADCSHAFDPAIAGDDDVRVFLDDVGGGIEFLDFFLTAD